MQLFFGAFYSCFGEKVLLIEQKIFLRCIKRQKQRYFRSLTKRWPWLINLQPFWAWETFFEQLKQPRPFFCPNFGQKNMKPSGCASCTAGALHGTTCRFMQRKLRFIFCGSAAKCFIKKRLTMKHCFRLHFITPRQAAKVPQYETASFHSAMKHSAIAPCDLSSIALCATDDEKMKNESFPFVM